MTDIYAYYFPQFYEIEENSKWWGKGFTDWQLVKSSRSLYSGHNQPRRPLLGYRDQSDPEVIKQQCILAKKYGVTGFNIYHYWFDSKPYLDSPVLNLLNNQAIDIQFFFTWANESWTRQWVGKPNDYLIKQNYYNSKSDLVEHYRYLSRFFHDSRYTKINSKPVLSIYRPEQLPDLKTFMDEFNKFAKKDGFDGVYFIACRAYDLPRAHELYSGFDGIVNFNPRYAINTYLNKSSDIHGYLRLLPEKLQSSLSSIYGKFKKINKYSYVDLINSVEEASSFCGDVPVYHSVVPDWDNTPRYGRKATLFEGVSIYEFKRFLDIAETKKTSSHLDLMFINAWNEWSESAYLEPDEDNAYAYLDAVRDFYSNCKC